MLKYNLSQIDSLSKKILSFLSKSDCIFLFGELGSGKTTFVRSLIHQLQEKNKIKKTEVTSPTYNLLNEYEIQNLKIMHYDLYRLKNDKEIYDEAKKYMDIFSDVPYIFNLGHGLLPETNPETLGKLVNFIKENNV